MSGAQLALWIVVGACSSERVGPEAGSESEVAGEVEVESEPESEVASETDVEPESEPESEVGEPDVEVGTDAGPDAAETKLPEVPLDGQAGLAARLVGLALDPAAPAPVEVLVQVEADGLRFELGATPSFFQVPAPSDSGGRTRVGDGAFVLAPGESRDLAALTSGAPLLAWVPGATSLDVTLTARTPDGAMLGQGTLHFAAGAPATQTVGASLVRLTVRAETGAAPLPPEVRVGLTLDGSLSPEALADVVSGPLALKVYAGARRWLLRAGCDSDAACAPGGANFPCVTTCACHCGASPSDACDCDFDGLAAYMEATAWDAARRIVGASDNADPALARVRLHWVFKRSLGGTSSCDAHGELDVDPATWDRFFAAATQAAIDLNTRAGFRLIDVLSPMNEANHPLQDGAHRNAAGQPSLGGFLDFRELIRQASCQAGRCCTPDRYIVADPDVPALLAAALAGGEAVRAAADPTLAPELAASLYLDTEQVDPIQVGPDGLPPSIVTPVAAFSDALVTALAAAGAPPIPARMLVVDTYPGSWGAPWFETPDRIIHHMDPTTGRIVRVDAVTAADQAIARALRAGDDFGARFGVQPSVVLGEVGWSTFDGDLTAQAAFVRRLFDATAAAHARDPRFAGFLWFKSRDRTPFVYPTWTEAANPLGGDPVACDAELLGPIVCAADVLAAMEGQWGLLTSEGAPKPAWDAFVTRWQRHAPGASR